MSTFNKDTHIIGKVYDLNQENMNLMLDYIEELKERIEVAEIDASIVDSHVGEVENDLDIAVKALQEIDKYCYNSEEGNSITTVGITAMDALISLGEAHSGA